MNSFEAITWAGGEHVFALRLADLLYVQEATDAGPEQVLMRLRHGQWRVSDVQAVLVAGLSGGGMEMAKAKRLVGEAMDAAVLPNGIGLIDFRVLAQIVLTNALTGPEGDVPGKPKGEAPPPESGNSLG